MFVDERAERHPVPERRGHVRNRHIPVALALNLTPLLKRFNRRHRAPTPTPTRTNNVNAADVLNKAQLTFQNFFD